MTPIIEVRELHKTYRRAGEVTRAVDGVSLALQPGESVGVIGESGSGKSTLARCITALERPTSGRVLFRGTDIADRSDRSLRWFRRQVQPVFQDPITALDPRWTARQLILEPLQIYREADRELRLRNVIDDVGLKGDLLSRRPRDLSGGERQRIAIARAIVLRPSVVVLDEPTASVDMSMRRSLLALLKRLQAEHGLTYLFISHDIRTIEETCSRIVVMYRGRVVEQGPTAAVLTSPGHVYTQVLVSSIPRPKFGAGQEGRRDRLRAAIVPGQVLSDEGCLFADRCPVALPECASPPPLVQVGTDHVAACVRARAGRQGGHVNATDRERARAMATGLLTACLPQTPREAAADAVSAQFRCWTPIHGWESGAAGLAALRQVMSHYGKSAPGGELLPVQALVTDGEQVVAEVGTASQPGQPPATTTFVVVLNSGKVDEVRCYLDPEVMAGRYE